MFTNNFKTKHDLKIFLVFKETNLKSLTRYVKIPKNVLKDFSGDDEQIISFYDSNRLNILVSLGQKSKITSEKLKRIVKYLKRRRNSFKNKKILYFLEEGDIDLLEQQIQEINSSHYHFDYKTKKNKNGVNKKSLKKSKKPNYQIYLKSKKIKPETQMILNDSINLLKNLGDEPSNILTPLEYIKRIKQVCKECGLKLKVYNSKDLKKKGMNSILSVAQGSNFDGYLAEIKCFNKGNEKPIVLVGKGITFDTGGISLKKGRKMFEMKGDMIGSAVVLAVMRNIGLMNIRENVIGLLPIAENMPDSGAIKPGDIINSYSGKTIEVMNTDAEGRLVMADALTYGQEFNPKLILDIATLTGQQNSMSCGMFGSIMGTEEHTVNKFIEIGKKTKDRVVELPLLDEFKKNNESNIADVKNAEYKCGASTIHAGAFLSHFINKNQNWIHIDIAGPSFLKNRTTGFGVRLITEYLKML